jgi:hypothetical protein
MPRFTTVRLLCFVTALGLCYAFWYAVFWKPAVRDRAHACRVNRNLIDAYVLFWEAREGYLVEGRAYTLDLDTGGAVASASPGLALKAGDRAIADAALDPEAFRCPEASGFDTAVHYRWTMSSGSRGAVCLMHGDHSEISRR